MANKLAELLEHLGARVTGRALDEMVILKQGVPELQEPKGE